MQSGNVQGLKVLLANTYTLYVKTQNFHWNVKSPNFIMFHEFFESQYEALAEAVDKIAERIRALNERAPGSLAEFIKLKSLEEAKPEEIDIKAMLNALIKDHTEIHRTIGMLLDQARKEGDEVTQDLLIERLEYHEKILWMLKAHL
jgi:starvation-inducible DNA-binding protein